MASNSSDSVQSSSSQPPANIMSCLPHWISLGGVADAMVRGRAGRRDRIVHALDLEPGRERRRRGRRHRLRHRERPDALRAAFLRVMSAASTMVARRRAARAHDDAGALVGDLALLERRRRGSPAPWRRGSRPRRRRGSAWRGGRPVPDGSSVGAPCTWQRKPSSANVSAREMPDLASRRLASTSCVLLPIDETMPIPVTTTRLITQPRLHLECERAARSARSRAAHAPLGCACVLLEQADLQVARPVDDRAVGRQPAVGDAEHQLRAHHPLDLDAVDDLLHRRQHLAGEFHLAQAERPALARASRASRGRSRAAATAHRGRGSPASPDRP